MYSPSSLTWFESASITAPWPCKDMTWCLRACHSSAMLPHAPVWVIIVAVQTGTFPSTCGSLTWSPGGAVESGNWALEQAMIARSSSGRSKVRGAVIAKPSVSVSYEAGVLYSSFLAAAQSGSLDRVQSTTVALPNNN